MNRTLRVEGHGDGWNGGNKGSFSEQPNPGRAEHREPMLLYISTTHQVVSAVLVVEREADGHKFPLQKPMYYVSTVLTP